MLGFSAAICLRARDDRQAPVKPLPHRLPTRRQVRERLRRRAGRRLGFQPVQQAVVRPYAILLGLAFHATAHVAAIIEGDGGGGVAAEAAAHVLTDLKAKLAVAQPQHRFKLGVALKAFRHVGHVLRYGLRRPQIAVAYKLLILLLQLLPALHEPVRALERIDADFRFRMHRAYGVMAASLRRLPDQFRACPERAVEVR